MAEPAQKGTTTRSGAHTTTTMYWPNGIGGRGFAMVAPRVVFWAC